ncbi:WD40 repeat domain-containing protein [Candidatus Laterigemmans baculatus]|uniref:WD40 repeat domain-containing protein n=1 Tax=Candidatus Laterigemmans baculatus TaxID=2770505 RepID=UPI0013DA90A6|nr:hypothetical protein [Candidatus Laterigemmans baculatus]
MPLVIEDHSDWVNSISWSPDGRSIISSSRDKTAKIFDAASGDLHVTFNGHNQNVTAAGFLEDATRAFSVGDDRRIRIWNTADAKQVRDIPGLAIEMDGLRVLGGEQILTAGSDGKIRLHKSVDGKRVREFAGAPAWVASLAVTADNERVIFGDHAGRLHLASIETDAVKSHSWTAAPE